MQNAGLDEAQAVDESERGEWKTWLKTHYSEN